jgi:hypothetical protein
MTAVDTGALIRRLREVRDIANDAKREGDQIRKLLLDIIEDQGPLVDEESGLRAYVKEEARYEYDPTALHSLVESGVMFERDFGECLKTVVDKKVVQEWVKKGLITDRQLAGANAKVLTGTVRKVEIEEIKRGRSEE